MTRYFKSILVALFVGVFSTASVATVTVGVSEFDLSTFQNDAKVQVLKNQNVGGNLSLTGEGTVTFNGGVAHGTNVGVKNEAYVASGNVMLFAFVTDKRFDLNPTVLEGVALWYANPIPARTKMYLSGDTTLVNPPNGIYYLNYSVWEYEGCYTSQCVEGYSLDYVLYEGQQVRVTNGYWEYVVAPPVTGTPKTEVAVEYYHAAFDHYFTTSIQTEINAIDSGRFAGWARTGYTYKVYALNQPNTRNVCRFFSVTFNPKSSHFYTSDPAECAAVKKNRDWQFEGEVGALADPSYSSVSKIWSCDYQTQKPLYRLYNNGKGGAPNHRYTVDSDVAFQMRGQGWVAEGYDWQGLIACTPN